MLVQSPVAGDARVIREATTLAAAGHDVHVIGRDVPADFVPPQGVSVESVGRARGLRPGGERPVRDPLSVRTARWLLLPEHRARVEHAWEEAAQARASTGPAADVVHSHDFNTLRLGARLARHWGAKLVYDTHEYWSGRPRVGRPTPVLTARQRRAERELGGRADVVLTVGDGVADALRRDHGWDRVRVVRNTFEPRIAGRRPDPPSGAVYAGRLAPYRELEVIAAASASLDLPVTLVGPADPAWLAGFDPGTAKIRPAATLEEVDGLLEAAGLALVTHSDRWPNHRLALPNKLFHAVRVGVPVVATDVGELGRAVRRYGLGTLYRAGDADDFSRAVGVAVATYPSLGEAVIGARPELSWPRDEAVLLATYEQLGT
jgi:glycogen(starch) synthase